MQAIFYNFSQLKCCSFLLILAEVAKQVLDRCIVSNPKTRDPKNEEFEVVFDYSFVEDHRDGHERWLTHKCITIGYLAMIMYVTIQHTLAPHSATLCRNGILPNFFLTISICSQRQSHKMSIHDTLYLSIMQLPN